MSNPKSTCTNCGIVKEYIPVYECGHVGQAPSSTCTKCKDTGYVHNLLGYPMLDKKCDCGQAPEKPVNHFTDMRNMAEPVREDSKQDTNAAVLNSPIAGTFNDEDSTPTEQTTIMEILQMHTEAIKELATGLQAINKSVQSCTAALEALSNSKTNRSQEGSDAV